MRKYNEGYVLPLVLVVLVVLCTVSLSVMAPAVSNLKVQEASIDRMQDRYEAIGDAKKAISDANNYCFNGQASFDKPAQDFSEDELLKIAKAEAYNTILSALSIRFETTFTTDAIEGSDDPYVDYLSYDGLCTQPINSKYYTICAYVDLTFSIVFEDSKEGFRTDQTTNTQVPIYVYDYTVQISNCTDGHYVISAQNGGQS